MACRGRPRNTDSRRGPRDARIRFRWRPDIAEGHARRLRPAAADRGDAEARMVRQSDQEVSRWQPSPRGAASDREGATRAVSEPSRHASNSHHAATPWSKSGRNVRSGDSLPARGKRHVDHADHRSRRDSRHVLNLG